MGRTLLLALLLTVTPTLQADFFQPAHMCMKPFKPFQFSHQWEIDSFNVAVQQYKQCILDFVNDQENAMLMHQMAADDAIQEWNSYVQFELN